MILRALIVVTAGLFLAIAVLDAAAGSFWWMLADLGFFVGNVWLWEQTQGRRE